MRGVSRARLDALGSGKALGRTGARAGPRSPHDAPPESDHQQGDERGTEQRLDARKQLRRRCVRRDVRVAQRRERDGAELQMLDEPLRRSKVLATDEYAAGKLIQHRNHISKLPPVKSGRIESIELWFHISVLVLTCFLAHARLLSFKPVSFYRFDIITVF